MILSNDIYVAEMGFHTFMFTFVSPKFRLAVFEKKEDQHDDVSYYYYF